MTLTESRPPKVLWVTQRLDVGGTERHITRVVPELNRLGLDVSVFVFERGGRLEEELARSGVSLYGCGSVRRRLLRLLRTAWELHRHLRRYRPDVVHFFLPEPYLVGSCAAIAARSSVRMMSRRSLSHYQSVHPVLARIERFLHRSTAALLANSTAVLEELLRESGDATKLGLIYNGVAVPQLSTNSRQIARQRQGVAADDLLLATVANLTAYKGHADVLDALAIARAKLPPGWRLFVVGRDDGTGAMLAARARELGLAEHVVWAGERDDVDQVLAAADIFVLASHQEGFSNSLIEAMAFGLPVIATAVGGNLDAVAPEQTGLLVPVQQPKSLAQAIVRLANDPSLRDRMGRAGRDRVRRLFSLGQVVEDYLSLYRGLGQLGSVSVATIIKTGRCDQHERL